MRPFPVIASILALSAFACGGEGDDGGGGGGGGGTPDADTGGGGDFVPASGAWDYGEFTPVTNTCNTTLIENEPDGGFGLLNNGDGTFTVTPGDGTDPFDCTQTGNAYTCAESNILEESFNGANVLGVGSVAGSFSSNTTVAGTRTLDVTCTGAGCAALETLGASFPCQLNVSFTGSLIQ